MGSRSPTAGAVGGVAAASAGAATLLTAPWAVLADLPPLEDLPLEDVAPKRQFGPSDTTFFGISFPMVLVGLAAAVTWAAFWVSSLMPAKDKEGTYKTYIGGGMLPPEGYTNPLDPRVSEEYADQEDPLYEKMGTKAASSAIV